MASSTRLPRILWTRFTSARTEQVDHHEARDAAEELRGQLVPGAAEKESAHRRRDAVEAVARRAIGEKSHRHHTPRPADAMDGCRADRVIDAFAFELIHCRLDEQPGHSTDDKCRPRIDQPRAAATGDRAAEQSAAEPGRLGVAASAPRIG